MSALPLARLFAAPDLNGPEIANPRFAPDGERLAFLKANPQRPEVLDLWLQPSDGRTPARLVLNGAAIEQGRALSRDDIARRERQRQFKRGIVEVQWHAGGDVLLAFAAEPLLAEAATGRLLAAPDIAGGADLRFSPCGRWIGFVRDGALWVAPTFGGGAQRISPPARDGIRYGVAEFVAQEEFARDTGYWWSPGGDALAYTEVDERHIEIAEWIETDARGACLASQRFPKAGAANAAVALFVQTLAGSEAVRVDLGPDPDFYLGRVHWSRDGRLLYVQRQSRDQRTLDLLAIDPTTGASRLLVRQHAAPWTNFNLDFHPLASGGFLWVNEQSGDNQLYLYDSEGVCLRRVSEGVGIVASRDRERGLAGVDEARGLAYVLASEAGPLERRLYAVDYRTSNPARPLTPAGGWWQVQMDAQAQRFVGRFSSPAQPPQWALYDADGARLCWLERNALDDRHPYAAYREGLPEPQFGQIEAGDGQKLDYVLLKPTHFRPGLRYPAIVQVYGGPGRQHVHKTWRSPVERLFLDAGYVFFQLDNRGACGRGLAFEAPIAGNLGGPEVEDQMRGAAFLRSLDFVDPDRIGVMGWSFGGYMTLRLMTEPASGFAAGAAGASVDNFLNYDTHYAEHYLGHPAQSPEAYARSAVTPRLAALHGPLMLLHGTADDNVLFEHCLRMVERLQALGKDFELMIYPGQRHAIVGEAAQRHVQQTLLSFFDRRLKQV